MSTPAALTAFVQREHPRLVRAVHLLLDDHAVAEEVAQEALLRAASRWEQVSAMDSPGGWTHRVAINLATSQLRRRQLERRARSRASRADEVVGQPDAATAITVRTALRAIPEAQRRLLVLRHVLDWTTADIAALDGASPEAVRQRLTRARTALRDQLSPELTVDETDDPDAAPAGFRRGPGASGMSVGRTLDVEETTDAH
jgi:RNA polymerase sigma-70 factor, ECF subfamily